jgi:hypothetical protein
MNSKKMVVFHLSNIEQYYGEFNENTKLKMLRSYLKDISHYSNFKFMFNAELCQDEEVSIREICKGSSNFNFLLKVLLGNTNNSTTTLSSTFKENLLLSSGKKTKSVENLELTDDFTRLSNINQELTIENFDLKNIIQENEIKLFQFQKENSSLNNIINELNNKFATLQKTYDNLLTQNLSTNKQLEIIKVDYSNIEIAYKELIEKTEREKNLINNLNKKKSVIISQEYTPSPNKRKSNFINLENSVDGSIVLSTEKNTSNQKKSILIKPSVANGRMSKFIQDKSLKRGDIKMSNSLNKKSSLQPNGSVVPDFKINLQSMIKSYSLEALRRHNLRLDNFKKM